MFLFTDQLTIFDSNDDLSQKIIGYEKKGFKVAYISRNEANDIIKKNHYSKKIVNTSTDHFGVYINNVLVGILQYGHALNPQSISNIIPNSSFENFRELNRMWLSDVAPKNSESRAISYSIKILKKRYKHLKWIQSFADERCGLLGVVYQASNFKYYGKHLSEFYEYQGETLHKLRLTNRFKTHQIEKQYQRSIEEILSEAKSVKFWQFRYIYFVDQKSINECLLDEKPYPKPGNF